MYVQSQSRQIAVITRPLMQTAARIVQDLPPHSKQLIMLSKHGVHRKKALHVISPEEQGGWLDITRRTNSREGNFASIPTARRGASKNWET